MLAKRTLPPEYREWNRRWGAPRGRAAALFTQLGRLGPDARRLLRHQRLLAKGRGPFSFQGNTSTRTYEYPWTYFQLVGRGPGRVLEIGGAYSGLQLVLSKEGNEVHNVDPFVDYGDTSYVADPLDELRYLNKVFGTDVTLHRATLPEAGLDGPFDAVCCVSTLEHLTDADREATLKTARELLAPGGLLVLTVDLFLNVAPFCDRAENQYGTNASIARIEEIVACEMVAGDRRELCGYPEFSTDYVLGNLEDFAISTGYPQLAQLVTFRAPG